jgi:hypothetical protein
MLSWLMFRWVTVDVWAVELHEIRRFRHEPASANAIAERPSALLAVVRREVDGKTALDRGRFRGTGYRHCALAMRGILRHRGAGYHDHRRCCSLISSVLAV